jgi:oligoendopeptidase F
MSNYDGQVSERREDTWDIEAIFADVASWQREFEAVRGVIPSLAAFSGTVLQSAGRLEQFLRQADNLGERVERLRSYAYLRFHGDTGDAEAKRLMEQVSALAAEQAEATSFFEPEVLSAPPGHVANLISSEESLRKYEYRFREIERARPHTLLPEVEAALAQLNPLRSIPEDVRTSIHDAEMQFAAIEVRGELKTLGHGNYDQFLTDADRDVRRRAYVSYTDGYLSRLASLGETLSKEATTAYLFSKVRKFSSVFDAKMYHENYTPEVFWSVVNTCADHRHLLQRYFRARAKLLGVSRIAEYDLMAPLSVNAPSVPYSQACELICESLAPLGSDYVSVARQGLTSRRWVDVYPRPRKYSNAFSAGSYLTQPYILMNYSPTIAEVGTLTHELGHSMHSLYANASQPSCYAGYSMSAAETASNLNQVLLRAHLFAQGERELEIAALEEAFFFVHRYLFVMPNLARLEYKLHTAQASRGPLGYREICDLTSEIFSEGYGGTVEFEPDRLGAKWAQFCHLYAPFYTFQYAIGISAAMAMGGRIISGDDSALKQYMQFLKAGGSRPPLEIFKIIDLDFTTSEPLINAFKVVAGYVERLERLAGV